MDTVGGEGVDTPHTRCDEWGGHNDGLREIENGRGGVMSGVRATLYFEYWKCNDMIGVTIGNTNVYSICIFEILAQSIYIYI